MKCFMSVGFLIVASAVPLAASANDFPTTSRVEYVLECMKNHDGKYEYMYKCSCAIDRMASETPYTQFVEIATAQRNESLGGQRGAEFRDPAAVKDMVRKYREIQQRANDACFIK